MDLLSLLLAGKYLALFVFAIIEGPVTMTAVGFLLRMDQLSFIPAFSAVLFGDLVGDVCWYALGYFGAHRFVRRLGRFFSLEEPMLEKIAKLFRRHEGWILFLSKITMGFGLAVGTLFTAGMSHVSLKKFIILNFLGGLIWTSFLLAIGYAFGHVYVQISFWMQIASMVSFILFLLGALAGFSRYAKRQILKKAADL